MSHSPYQERTVGETVLRLCDDLSQAGVEEARLEAELLVAHVMGKERAHLLAAWGEPMSPAALPLLADLVERRVRREPLSYLVGWREFYGLRFAVRSGVLIPRPETETVVDAALRLAAQRYGDAPVVVDVGCGCGAIAAALATHLPRARVYAMDNARIPVEVSAENFRRHRVEERVTLLEGDLLAPLTEPVDIVVANLPYVRSGDFAAIQPEVLWEPREALDGGPDGLAVILRMLGQLTGKVRTGATVLMECDPRQAELLVREAKRRFPGCTTKVLQDLARLDRVVEVLL
ncbi:MAG: peptide chain release factor N(5)-glutamine methyltransferase [Chloroflexi bacterium]|nr:peptide chain release factor N(5)-glutamine methyltransferase [Chloroflexota bacterium]